MPTRLSAEQAMHLSPNRFPTDPDAGRGAIIVGGGPAGLAVLLAASRTGRLARLLEEGLTIVERGPSLGAGALGGWAVTSDSDADTFLSSVRDHPMSELAALADGPEARAIASHGGGSGVPLAEVGAFLDVLGAAFARIVEAGGGRVLTGCEALGAAQTEDGWRLRVRRLADGAVLALPARCLVTATGGVQSADALAATMLAGMSLGERCGDRLVRSHDVLREGGAERLARRLEATAAPKIAILGGSTSAMTAASLILKSPLGARLGAGGVALLHRSALRPYYRSADAARADGYTTFGADDVCPVSGFVHRLGGFRTDSRELALAALGTGGRQPDARLRLHRMRPSNERATLALIAEADVVIGALGYRPRALPLRDGSGAPIGLAAHAGRPMVDGMSRVLDAAGAPLPGLFGIGLAAGFRPSGALGGEPSFRGQANGLWLWQNAVGGGIAEQLLPDRAEHLRRLVRLADPRLSRAA
jgi:hypothetical protein